MPLYPSLRLVLLAAAATATAGAPAAHAEQDAASALDAAQSLSPPQGPGLTPGQQRPGARPSRPSNPTQQTESDDEEAASPLFAWRSVWSRSTSFDEVSNNATSAPKLPQRPGSGGTPSGSGPGVGGGGGPSSGGPITNWTPYMQIPAAPRPISIYMP